MDQKTQLSPTSLSQFLPLDPLSSLSHPLYPPATRHLNNSSHSVVSSGPALTRSTPKPWHGQLMMGQVRMKGYPLEPESLEPHPLSLEDSII